MGYDGTEAIDNQSAHQRFFPRIPQAAFSQKHGKATACGVARPLDRIYPVWVARPKKRNAWQKMLCNSRGIGYSRVSLAGRFSVSAV